MSNGNKSEESKVCSHDEHVVHCDNENLDFEEKNFENAKSMNLNNKMVGHKRTRQNTNQNVIIAVGRPQIRKHFDGIPEENHRVIEVYNDKTGRYNQHFQCNFPGCGIIFKKSSNIRNHFKKHTGLKPFVCVACGKVFSQKGNL